MYINDNPELSQLPETICDLIQLNTLSANNTAITYLFPELSQLPIELLSINVQKITNLPPNLSEEFHEEDELTQVVLNILADQFENILDNHKNN